MDNLKEKFKKIIGMIDPKLLKLYGVLLVVIVVFLIIGLVAKLVNAKPKKKVTTFENIEQVIIKATEKYFEKNMNEKPEKGLVTLSIDKLVADGYMKDLSYYTPGKDSSCSASVKYFKSKNKYLVIPTLDCGEKYRTKKLVDEIKKTVLNDPKEMVPGLYDVKVSVLDSYTNLGVADDGYDLSSNELLNGYIYRGDNVKNYLKLEKTLYRIIRIDGRGDLVIMPTKSLGSNKYDYRYNIETNKKDGINEYKLSYVKELLDKEYEKMASKNQPLASLLVEKNICVGSRRPNQYGSDGYIECQEALPGEYYSLMPTNYYLNASLDTNCNNMVSTSCVNYNYLSKYQTWTNTKVEGTSNKVFVFDQQIVPRTCDKLNGVYPIYYVNGEVNYLSGDGSLLEPYKIKIKVLKKTK